MNSKQSGIVLSAWSLKVQSAILLFLNRGVFSMTLLLW